MTSPRPHLRLVAGSRSDERGPLGAEDRGDAGDDLDLDAPAQSEETAPPRVSPRHVVLVGVAFQAMGTLSFATRYFSLSRDQAVSPAAALLSVPGVIALYVAAVLLARQTGRGRTPFLIGAIALGLAVPFWGIAATWTWPVALGAMLGLAGAWVAREPAPGPSDEDAPEDAESPAGPWTDRDRTLH